MQGDNFRGPDEAVFEMYLLLFVCFPLDCMYMYHTCILMRADATLRLALHCPFFSTLDVKLLYTHSC